MSAVTLKNTIRVLDELANANKISLNLGKITLKCFLNALQRSYVRCSDVKNGSQL